MFAQRIASRLEIAGFGGACVLAASLAAAADLRPALELPSQREAINPAQQQVGSASLTRSTAAQVAVPADAFYIKFEDDARNTMDRAKREALRKDFVKRYNEARKRNASTDVQHYRRLIGILTTIAVDQGEVR
jgi:hypothetical protein